MSNRSTRFESSHQEDDPRDPECGHQRILSVHSTSDDPDLTGVSVQTVKQYRQSTSLSTLTRYMRVVRSGPSSCNITNSQGFLSSPPTEVIR